MMWPMSCGLVVFALFGVHWEMPKRVMVCCLDAGIGLLLMIAYLFRIC